MAVLLVYVGGQRRRQARDAVAVPAAVRPAGARTASAPGPGAVAERRPGRGGGGGGRSGGGNEQVRRGVMLEHRRPCRILRATDPDPTLRTRTVVAVTTSQCGTKKAVSRPQTPPPVLPPRKLL